MELKNQEKAGEECVAKMANKGGRTVRAALFTGLLNKHILDRHQDRSLYSACLQVQVITV